jgi:hypothetical protein
MWMYRASRAGWVVVDSLEVVPHVMKCLFEEARSFFLTSSLAQNIVVSVNATIPSRILKAKNILHLSADVCKGI